MEASSLPQKATPENPAPEPFAEIERLKAELQQLRLAYHRLQELERFKAGFLARTAHELRSPLNSVMSLQQLILADLCEDPAEERQFISQSYEAAQKLLGLLDRLISVSKADYGSEQLKIQAVSLEDVVMEVESMLMLQAQNRSQKLNIEYLPTDVQVKADAKWLRQVLVSLVDTPMRLMQEGVISVIPNIDPETQSLRIQITDERPVQFWQEPLDLLQTLRDRGKVDPQSSKPDIAAIMDLGLLPSPGLSLLINQTLLQLMGGQLEVLAVPTEADSITCIQCTLSLA